MAVGTAIHGPSPCPLWLSGWEGCWARFLENRFWIEQSRLGGGGGRKPVALPLGLTAEVVEAQRSMCQPAWFCDHSLPYTFSVLICKMGQ